MNFKKLIASALTGLCLATSALGQGIGLNAFEPLRVFPMTAANCTIFTAGTKVTNSTIDRILFTGTAVITMQTSTNATGNSTGTLTAQVYTSPDSTNWTALANYATVTSNTTFAIVNSRYTTLVTNNNAVLLPGLTNAVTASTAGYASQGYITSLQYTNTGALTVTPPGWFQIAFKLQDNDRYVQLVWSPSATSGTNFTASATLTAVPIVPYGD